MDGVKLKDVLRGMWLRRWLLAALAVGLSLAGLAVVAGLPAQYRATVVIAARAQHPSGDIVLPTVSTQPEDRLKTLEPELLAAPLLRQVVTDLNFAPGLHGMDARQAQLRSQLDLKVDGDNVFTLTVTARDPKLAAAIANRLPQLYADEVKQDRLAQASRAAAVFAPEIKALRATLARQEAGIAQFKADHLGDLPEQLDGNLRGLDRMTLLGERDVEALMDAERRRAALLEDGHDDATALGRLRRRHEELDKELTDARSQWTDDHPEVQRLRRDLAMTDAELRSAEARQGQGAHELHAVESEIGKLHADQAALAHETENFRRRVAATPAVAEDLAALVRDRDAAQTKYQALVGRQVEAELALDLEKRQAPDLFRVVAPATVPTRPAKPDRATGYLLAVLVALVATALVGTALEISDDTVRDGRDAATRLGVPVLAVVPSFAEARGQAVRRADRR